MLQSSRIRIIRFSQKLSAGLTCCDNESNHEADAVPYITLCSMQKLETRLPSCFIRVHRSYIVNLQKIKEISRLRIRFDDKKQIPIGENYKAKVMNYIARHGIV